MLWQEDSTNEPAYVVPDDIVDLNFKVRCRSLPLDHAYALSRAVQAALPWLAGEERAGIHLIHGAESGNGWIRPEDPDKDVLYLSRRTRFTLRLPKERVAQAEALAGTTLEVAGNSVGLSDPSVRPLSDQTTLFARYVISERAGDDEGFVEDVAAMLAAAGISVRKLLSGRRHRLRTPDGEIDTRSVMIADLDIEDSVRLQQQGLGPGRKIGCGLFLPHKGINAVGSSQRR